MAKDTKCPICDRSDYVQIFNVPLGRSQPTTFICSNTDCKIAFHMYDMPWQSGEVGGIFHLGYDINDSYSDEEIAEKRRIAHM